MHCCWMTSCRKAAFTNPEYFTAAIMSYLALGVIALFTSVPKAERAYAAPIVPLYLCYAITHIVPMTVGFVNFFALKLFRRRIYQDHYESPVGCEGLPRKKRESANDCRGMPAPDLYSPQPVLGGSRAALRRRTRRTGRRLRLRHAGVLQSRHSPGTTSGARTVAEGAGTGTRVLDVGCGVGRWSRLLAARGADVTGVDLSPTMIAQARTAGPHAEGVAHRCRFLSAGSRRISNVLESISIWCSASPCCSTFSIREPLRVPRSPPWRASRARRRA